MIASLQPGCRHLFRQFLRFEEIEKLFSQTQIVELFCNILHYPGSLAGGRAWKKTMPVMQQKAHWVDSITIPEWKSALQVA